MLSGLRDKGFKFAILSNKTDELTKTMVNYFLPDFEFAAVFGARDGHPKKPAPDSALEIAALFKLPPDNILYLGDTDVDMRTADAAGMYGIGALWGFRTADELKSAGAKALLSAPKDFLNLTFENN